MQDDSLSHLFVYSFQLVNAFSNSFAVDSPSQSLQWVYQLPSTLLCFKHSEQLFSFGVLDGSHGIMKKSVKILIRFSSSLGGLLTLG